MPAIQSGISYNTSAGILQARETPLGTYEFVDAANRVHAETDTAGNFIMETPQQARAQPFVVHGMYIPIPTKSTQWVPPVVDVAKAAPEMPIAKTPEPLCCDEGCPQSETPHVCVNDVGDPQRAVAVYTVTARLKIQVLVDHYPETTVRELQAVAEKMARANLPPGAEVIEVQGLDIKL